MARKAADTTKSSKGINATLAELQKQFGAGSVVRMGDAPREEIQVISTGVIGIDIALGRGGIPRGRIVEIYGPESSGKTTLALNLIAQDQKQGNVCAFIDAEHALDAEYAQDLGVQVDDLIFSQPDDGEQALEIMDRLAESGDVSLIVVDSVAALTPRSEIEGEMGDSNVGKHARLMSQALRKVTAKAQKNGTTIIFINQLREKIGVMFGSPETTTGGKALKFYASVRIDVRSSPLKEGTEVIGNTVRIKVVKNKVAPPFKTCELKSYWGKGYDKADSLVEEAQKAGVIQKNGAWAQYKGKNGRSDDYKDRARTDPEFMEQLYNEVAEIVFSKTDPASITVSHEDDEIPVNVNTKTGEVLDYTDDSEDIADDLGSDNTDAFDA